MGVEVGFRVEDESDYAAAFSSLEAASYSSPLPTALSQACRAKGAAAAPTTTTLSGLPPWLATLAHARIGRHVAAKDAMITVICSELRSAYYHRGSRRRRRCALCALACSATPQRSAARRGHVGPHTACSWALGVADAIANRTGREAA